MRKWIRCDRCLAWVPPETSCSRCIKLFSKHEEMSSFRLFESDSAELVTSTESKREAEILLPALQKSVQVSETKQRKFSFDDERDCVICGSSFSGKTVRINVCLDCESNDVQVLTGVMIIGGKNSMEIQINSDPKVTEYINSASTRHGTAPDVVSRKDGGTVRKIVTGLENRRHGESK